MATYVLNAVMPAVPRGMATWVTEIGQPLRGVDGERVAVSHLQPAGVAVLER